MIRLLVKLLALFVLLQELVTPVVGSVYLAQSKSASCYSLSRSSSLLSSNNMNQKDCHDIRWALKQHRAVTTVSASNGATRTTAVAIPGYSVPEQIFVGGFLNFLSIYNLVITARILLSWFPQAQGIGLLQPVFAITDPYLNLFRGIVPPIFGLDLSPILAFFLLNALSSATVALGAEIPDSLKEQLAKQEKRNKGFFGISAFARKNKNNFPLALGN